TFVQWVIKNTYLGDILLYGIRFVQHFSVWAALVFLYIFIPNTKVHFKSALVGGILAGTLWQIVQWGYVHFQVGVGRYNAIYGTLSVLPVFLVWIFTSWLIVLFGVEVVCAHQNIRTFRRELRVSVSHGLQELLSLAILQSIATAFYFGRPAYSIEALAEELDIPVRVVRELLDILQGAGYVVKTAGEPQTYQPARDLEHISLIDVLHTLKNFGGVYKITRISESERLVADILKKVDASSAAAVSGMTLKHLIESTDTVSTESSSPESPETLPSDGEEK
ncbi:MAG: ribonuclease BN, partial [Geobacter sp.]